MDDWSEAQERERRWRRAEEARLSTVEHAHSFAVDISCECGIMLSEYVRGLKRQRDELADALIRLKAQAAERAALAAAIREEETTR